MKRISPYILFLFMFFAFSLNIFTDEGMYPLSEIYKLDLKSKDFQINAKELYNPNGISLVDGIINLSGCTALFVSSDGLILTNYHCAFRAIQGITTKEKDYMRSGFLAKKRSEELQAKGYTLRIIESYKDVSREVLSAVRRKMNLVEQAKAIEKKTKKIIIRTEKKYPGKRAEVAEMFRGKSYVLFIYTYIKDVRLVYSPPRSIGEFGGEIDNWMWPRHTGDFSFMRAYISPDGKLADYSLENVPFHPKKHIKIAPQGVNEGDFVFILGYPGRTYRHNTSYFLSFEENVRMPYVVKLYKWMISIMEKMSKKDRSIAIKLAPRIRGLSNTEKNYRGKLKGIKRLNLVKKRRENEKMLQSFINADKKRKHRYGVVLNKIYDIYKEKRIYAGYDQVMKYLLRNSYLLNIAFKVYESSIERKKTDTERESAYMERNFSRTKKFMFLRLKNFHEQTDKIVFKEMLLRAFNLRGNKRIPAVDRIVGDMDPEKAINAYIENSYKLTKVKDRSFLIELFGKSKEQLDKMGDPFIVLAKNLYPNYRKLKEREKRYKGALDNLLAKLISVKKQFLGKDFIPDANGTLRLTYGRIKGYSPSDAVCFSPITTLRGMLEKNTGEIPFFVPQKLSDLYYKKDFGRFKHKDLNNVPVAMLYDMDTTGGNSGSPVLNSKGELVGLNFDRVFEATINDYAWNENYSRSIGVDIRFVLWFTQKFGGADYILKEMGIKNI